MAISPAKQCALSVLRKCRINLIQDFLSHEPAIFGPSYKYEDSEVLLGLARDKYFTAWLASHWQVFSDSRSEYPKNEHAEAEQIFSWLLSALLNKWSKERLSSSLHTAVGLKIIEEMQFALGRFIEAGENTDTLRNRLQVSIDRSQRLFDREFNKLSEVL